MEYLIALAVFLLVTLIVIAGIRSITHYDRYQQRLQSLQSSQDIMDVENRLDMRSLGKQMLQRSAKIFASRSFTDRIQAQLLGAGIPLKGEEYITLWIIVTLLLPVLLYLPGRNPLMIFLGLVLGALTPRIYLNYKRDARLQALNLQLGDALTIMANGLRAGFGFQQAMDTVRNELPDPISSEFSWTIQEMNLGFSHEEALLNLGRRTGSEDLDMIITGIIIQRQVGGNLAQILDNISETIRERTRIKREIKVLTAQGRLSGLIIGLLPLVLIVFMLMINPSYFTVMIKDMRGIIMLGTAVCLEIIGFILIRKIIDIRW